MNAELPLRDIHLPELVSWWPLAPGWWLLVILGFIVAFLFFFALKKIRQPVLNKSAKAEVGYVINHFQKHQDTLLLLQELSIAYKRIGISYLGRNNVAGLSGQDWYQRVNQLVNKEQLSDVQIALLSQAPYQKSPILDDDQIKLLIQQSQRWVNALPRAGQRVSDV